MAVPDYPPQPTSIVNLAYASIVIFALMMPVAGFVTYKHGKPGMICWPIFVSFFPMRIMTDVFTILKKDNLGKGLGVLSMTNAGCIACLSLAIIGMVYEALCLVPSPGKGWGRKAILGATHLLNTAGIGMAAYAGKADTSEDGGVKNLLFNKIGNIMVTGVMVAVLFWLWPAGKRVLTARQDTNYKAAKMLIVCAGPAAVLQLIRLVYGLTYAFNRLASLDPLTGSFATKFILVFGAQLLIALVILFGGWQSMGVRPQPHVRVRGDPMEMSPNAHLV